jgi:hypothetical protein
MTWAKYALHFRLLQPLHIGYRRVGNLQQTRTYVPAKVMWASLTARLTRQTHHRPSGNQYDEIGRMVEQYFRFSYFYPALEDKQPYYHWDNASNFAYRFLNSYASTALNYDQYAAEEGLLHEVEFIAPYARPLNDGESSSVYLVGYLYVRDDLDEKLQDWWAALHKLQLGGERGYGWGRVQLICGLQKPVDEGLNEPQVEYKAGKKIMTHALAVDKNGRKAVTNVTGPIEPLVGWERDNDETNSRKWRVSQAIVCYAPGARVTEDVIFTIGHYGILEK